MKIIQKNIAELKRPERNVRIHNSKQLHEFQRSIKMFGQIRPLVIDENGVILAGNGLYEALLSLDYAQVDCYIVNGLSEAHKKKLMLADNRIYDLGLDDIDTLDAFIRELGDDFDIPGFDAELLQALAMEAEAASEAMGEYGLIDEEKFAKLTSVHQNFASQEQNTVQPQPAPAQAALNVSQRAENSQTIAQSEDKPFVLCPKCGERIWL